MLKNKNFILILFLFFVCLNAKGALSLDFKIETRNNIQYLVDEDGTAYRYANDTAALSRYIQALDLRHQSLEQLPDVLVYRT